jgi:hypothetical protein
MMDRFEVRKANGMWHVFDRDSYSAVRAYFSNEFADALRDAAFLNSDEDWGGV